MCFLMDTVTNTEELSALHITSQEHTEVYTANSAEQLSQGLETMKGKQQWNNPHGH